MKEKILELIRHNNMTIEKIQANTNIDYEELNEILSELMEEQQIFLNTQKRYELLSDKYLVGVLEKTSKGSSYVTVNNEKIAIDTDSLHTALKYDTVVIEKKYHNCGVIKGILHRKNNKLVCEIKEWNNKLVLVPFNGNCEINLITSQELLKDYIIGDRVYINLTNESSEENDLVVRNLTKIGHFNDQFNDELAIAISKDFDIEFSKKAMEEAEKIPLTVQEEDKKDRLDLTEEKIFTIDSIHTKDMDDAISIKLLDNGNYELGVHIADVAHYIKPGSQLFKEAMRRGTSVYLGDVVIPMIPNKLSNGICSLNEGVERLTKSCIMEIDKSGKVINYKITDSVIKSKKKMTYEELNELFKGNPVDESYAEFTEDLKLTRQLSNILLNAKKKNGHIDFESSDIIIKKDIYNDDKILEFQSRESDEAERLIEHFMILTNEVVAADFYWRELPFIYRTHDFPNEEKIEDTIEQIKELGLGKKLTRIQNAYGPKVIQNILDEYKEKAEFSVVSNLLLRSMAKAKYTTNNIGHFALALDYYCHFTSPIRRLPDLIIHILIDRFKGNEEGYKQLEKLQRDLTKIAAHASYKERQADDAEKDYLKLKMAEYMAEHMDEEFEGMILDIDKDKVFIKLDNNVKCLLDNDGDFALSFVPIVGKKALTCKYSKQNVKLGTRVSTKVTMVDIPQKQVYLDVKEILKEKNKQSVRKLEIK